MTPLVNLNVKKLDIEAKLIVNDFEQNDAGYDVFAKEDVTLHPGKSILHTGIAVQTEYLGLDLEEFMKEPHNFKNPQTANTVKAMLDFMFQNQFRPWVQVRDKSSKAGLGLEVSAGIVDDQYTGEIMVMFTNVTDEPIEIAKHEKVTQIIPMLTPIAGIVETDTHTETKRGAGKMGSTGKM